MIWRLVLSDRINDSKWEIENRWTLDDLFDAHDLLDIFAAAEDRALAKSKTKR